MVIALRAQATGNTTNTTVTIALPTYLTSDYIAFVVASNNANALTFSSNVTAVTISNAGNRIIAYQITPQDGSQTSFTFAVATNSVFTWWIASYSGVDKTATVYGANNQIGNSTASSVAVPEVQLPFLATGNELAISAAGVNSTATWTTTSGTLYATTSGNAALQVQGGPALTGHLTTTFSGMDRGSAGSSRNQNAVAFILQPVQSVSMSALTNGSFEGGTTVATGWNTEQTVTGTPVWSVQTTGVIDGGTAQQLVYTGQAGDTSQVIEIYQAPIPATPGRSFEFSVWMSGTQTVCAALVGIEAFDASNTYISETDQYLTLTATPTRYAVTYLCPPGTDHVAAYIQFNEIGSTSAVTAYMDQAMLVNAGASTTGTLAGTGTLAATAAAAVSAVGTLSGTGALTTTVTESTAAAASFSGAGAMAVTVAPTVLASASMTGSGNMAAVAVGNLTFIVVKATLAARTRSSNLSTRAWSGVLN
jgi:hypothetical protein